MPKGASRKTGSKLEEELGLKRTMLWEKADAKRREAIEAYAKGYKAFLDAAKTEREAIRRAVEMVEGARFKSLGSVSKLRAGARVYLVNREKNLAAAVIGRRPLTDGLRIVAAHVDAPRLDLKQRPLFEDADTHLALLRTHYYGGLKRYQWVNHPLAIHGVVIRRDGTRVELRLGEAEEEPVLVIPDLLPHLYRNSQAKRKLSEGIKGEELMVLVGSLPLNDPKAKRKVKLWILQHLHERYGIVEEDLVSAELEIVPAGKARDIGLDGSMIGAYGQDDRACVYPALTAIMGTKRPEYTGLVLLVDKEEIGSDGPTGVKSRFFEDFVGELLERTDPDFRDADLRRALSRSKALSADVNAGVNPIFKEVHEMTNAALIGHGVVLTKYTGSGGKYSSNDATAEYVGEVRRLFNAADVLWQAAELGKVDEGGGGTVAKFLAEHNMDVLDIGPALLSMHSPFEISSKADLYETHRALSSFFMWSIE